MVMYCTCILASFANNLIHQKYMITNERILAEILARKQKSLEMLEDIDLPDELKPVLEQFHNQDEDELVSLMAKELLPNFSFDEYEEVQYMGFEWYYDGRSFPEALGYFGKSCEPAPDASQLPVGSDTHEARKDFEVGSERSGVLCGDCGYIDVNLVFGPLYDVLCEEGDNHVELEDDEAADLLENLYTLRLYEIVHLAMQKLEESDGMMKNNMKSPFYAFLNNHDWDPFLVYAIG